MTQLEIYYQNDGYLRDFEYQWYYYKEFNHYSCCGYLKRHDGFWWLFFDVRIIDVLPLLSYWIETCFELPDPVTDALLLVETALTPSFNYHVFHLYQRSNYVIIGMGSLGL